MACQRKWSCGHIAIALRRRRGVEKEAVVPFSSESGKVAYGGPPDAPVERRCP